MTLQRWYSALFHLMMFQWFVSKCKIILVVIFVCCVQLSTKTFDHIRAKSRNYVQNWGTTSWLQVQSDCEAEKINIILRDINMGSTLKRCMLCPYFLLDWLLQNTLISSGIPIPKQVMKNWRVLRDNPWRAHKI